jgi:hypothetical protein
MKKLLDDIPISREENSDVAERAQCAGQGRRNGRKAAHTDVIVHFSGNEQDPQEAPSNQP